MYNSYSFVYSFTAIMALGCLYENTIPNHIFGNGVSMFFNLFNNSGIVINSYFGTASFVTMT